ncbi:tyrosine-type recombinase/integrase [Synechococcus sp. MIT S9508]|uniref:tyrosine-type recombinase/integrase n=1 Tax=Synechococcus sp. MIT S9508 TaxID=1801629 RepID=UPI00082B60E9|nr:tyrosine-type recombinase/integrase [Synechococcus sp. MIT S9508]
MRKARNGYQLQRGVPKDVQPVIGKTIWVESAGSTYRVAQRLSPVFAAKTDRLIAEARNEVSLTGDELIDAVPDRCDLSDPEVVEALLTGCDVEVEEGALTREQASRYRAILKGKEKPRDHLSKEELIQQAKALKAPAARTEMSWRSALDDFLAHAAVTHPTAATMQHAVAYRSWLLERLSPSTVKTRLAFLSGLWSVLCELRPDSTHIFQGLNKRIKVVKSRKSEVTLTDPSQWQGSGEQIEIFQFLYFTGARLAEIAGLQAEDLCEDRILIRPNESRPLKTEASERSIPIHPRLQSLVIELRKKNGLLWPGQYQESNKRWGVNLSKPCKKIVGVTPKGFRDRVATVLRANNMNEAVVVALLGHTPNSISMAYGATPWKELKRAIKLL